MFFHFSCTDQSAKTQVLNVWGSVAHKKKCLQLSFLNQLSAISEHIKYKVTCMCFNAINGSDSAYLS